MEGVEVRFERDLQRCPFCHEQIVLAEEEWVACKQCLARHHSACWQEGGRCSTCRGEAVLVDAGQPAPKPRPRAGSRRRRAGLRGTPRAALETALGYFTLGIFPMVASELRLSWHLDTHSGEVDEVRRKTGLASRIAFPSLAFVLGYFALGATVLFARFQAIPPNHDDYMFALMFVTQLMATVPAMGFLHLFRKSVRQHEESWLKAEGVSPELVERTKKAWSDRKKLDVVLSLLALVPIFGVLLVFILPPRITGALELHEDHEEELAPSRSPTKPALEKEL